MVQRGKCDRSGPPDLSATAASLFFEYYFVTTSRRTFGNTKTEAESRNDLELNFSGTIRSPERSFPARAILVSTDTDLSNKRIRHVFIEVQEQTVIDRGKPGIKFRRQP